MAVKKTPLLPKAARKKIKKEQKKVKHEKKIQTKIAQRAKSLADLEKKREQEKLRAENPELFKDEPEPEPVKKNKPHIAQDHPALLYLDTFETPKFSFKKNRQTFLIQHFFKEGILTPERLEKWGRYVKGLVGAQLDLLIAQFQLQVKKYKTVEQLPPEMKEKFDATLVGLKLDWEKVLAHVSITLKKKAKQEAKKEKRKALLTAIKAAIDARKARDRAEGQIKRRLNKEGVPQAKWNEMILQELGEYKGPADPRHKKKDGSEKKEKKSKKDKKAKKDGDDSDSDSDSSDSDSDMSDSSDSDSSDSDSSSDSEDEKPAKKQKTEVSKKPADNKLVQLPEAKKPTTAPVAKPAPPTEKKNARKWEAESSDSSDSSDSDSSDSDSSDSD